MEKDRSIQVPVSLLLDPELTPSTKVLWIALRRQTAESPTKLAKITGLSVQTVRSGIERLRVKSQRFTGPQVKLPVALLGERPVGAPAKVIYGLLQATPNFRRERGEYTYPALSRFTGLAPNTLKRGIKELVETGWIEIAQTNRLRAVQFALGTPQQFRNREELAAAERRLRRASYGGEALMQEYLTLLIDSDQFTENARPGFLASPLTGERLELDRFYPQLQVAFEFQGAQHYGPTGQFSQGQADGQRLRDLLKAGLCLYEGVQLILIHPEDLSLTSMIEKVGGCLPQRPLADHESLIEMLERASLTYQAASRAGRARDLSR